MTPLNTVPTNTARQAETRKLSQHVLLGSIILSAGFVLGAAIVAAGAF